MGGGVPPGIIFEVYHAEKAGDRVGSESEGEQQGNMMDWEYEESESVVAEPVVDEGHFEAMIEWSPPRRGKSRKGSHL